MSDVVVLKVMSKENAHTSAIQGKWLSDKVALDKVHDKYRLQCTPSMQEFHTDR